MAFPEASITNATKLILLTLAIFAGTGTVKFFVTIAPAFVPINASPLTKSVKHALKTWLCSKLTIGFCPLKYDVAFT